MLLQMIFFLFSLTLLLLRVLLVIIPCFHVSKTVNNLSFDYYLCLVNYIKIQ